MTMSPVHNSLGWTMHYFCTFFDRRYLARGLALYESLVSQREAFTLWVLCMDEETFAILSKLGLEHALLLRVDDLISEDPSLRAAQTNRTLVEFYFTSKSFLCTHIFREHREVDLIIYLDADMYFFGSSSAISQEMDGFSVGLTPHRFPLNQSAQERYGRYNAGFISFRRDDQGMECLGWWRESCLAWCRDQVEDGKYADQGYLDRMPERFSRVKSIAHRGINCAPWNISQYTVGRNGATVTVDGSPLVLYHFHGVNRVTDRLYDCGLASYDTVLTGIAKENIYRPYIRSLTEQYRRTGIPAHLDRIRQVRERHVTLKRLLPGVVSFVQRTKRVAKTALFGSYLMIGRMRMP